MPDAKTLIDLTSGSKNSAEELFASDINPIEDGFLYIHAAVDTTCILQYTIDGTSFVEANDGIALIAGRGYILEIPVKVSDLINFKQSSGGAVSFTFFRVHQ